MARAGSYGVSQVSERHVGRWRGRLSGSAASAFPSDEVELTLSPDHTGTLLFLGAEPPPAPRSAVEGYLCDGEELRGSLWFKSNLDASLLTLRRQP